MATPQHHLGKTAGCEPDGISDGASRVATRSATTWCRSSCTFVVRPAFDGPAVIAILVGDGSIANRCLKFKDDWLYTINSRAFFLLVYYCVG